MTEQTILPVRIPDTSTFANFLADGNTQTISTLREFLESETGTQTCLLVGDIGSGKTHLLFAACNSIPGSVYLPFMDLQLEPDYLDGLEDSTLVCIDDVHSVAGQPKWEAGLFALMEKIESRSHLLLVSAQMVPAELDFQLKDLVNRFQGRQILKLLPTTNTMVSQILRERAAGRGLILDETVIQFILSRYSRDVHSLMRLLNRMDERTMIAQRKITIPFLKQFREFSSAT